MEQERRDGVRSRLPDERARRRQSANLNCAHSRAFDADGADRHPLMPVAFSLFFADEECPNTTRESSSLIRYEIRSIVRVNRLDRS